MKALVVIVLSLACTSLQADDDIQTVASPDGKYFAATREIPDQLVVWKKDADRFCLVISPNRDAADVDGSFYRWDCPSHEVVSQLAWTPDSSFLVITTTSSGGHSPWHFPTYVFCVRDKSVRYLDDTIGLVSDPGIEFTGSHTVKLSFFRAGASVPKEIDLAKTTPGMKREAVLSPAP
jgi:hypothetical protein